MKFNVTTPSTAAVCITGMNNKVTLDFSKPTETGTGLTGSTTNKGFSYSMVNDGLITMSALGSHDSETPVERWAIVLPQEALTTPGEAYTAGDYTGTRPVLPAISSNQYLDGGVALYMNTSLGTPLTFEAKTAGAEIAFVKYKNGSLSDITLQYSTDGYNWNDYTVTYTSDKITLANVGDKVMFRANSNSPSYNALAADNNSNHRFFTVTDDCYVYGNIMSLLKKDFSAETELKGDYTFSRLFKFCDKIYNHDSRELVLPATTLKDYCYAGLFFDCTNITKAPELPATELKSNCYNSMFVGCISLGTVPVLNASVMVEDCYYGMFLECTSLTVAPTLSSTSLAKQCYDKMFYGCTSLVTAPELPATILAEQCYEGMFGGCTGLKTAPILPAQTLVDHCYFEMFNGCTNLNSITCLATSISAESCTAGWVLGVAASGTFTKSSTMLNWTTGVNGIPENWTVQNAAK